jgi:hypothetical protein
MYNKKKEDGKIGLKTRITSHLFQFNIEIHNKVKKNKINSII